MRTLYERNISPEMMKYGYWAQQTKKRTLLASPHGHTFYEFVLVLEGNCIESVNGITLNLNEGELGVILPGDEHFFISQSDDADLLVLSVVSEEVETFSAAYGDELLKAFGQRQVFKLDTSVRIALLDGYNRLFFCGDNDKLTYYRLLMGVFAQGVLGSFYNSTKDMPQSFADAIAGAKNFSVMAGGVEALEKLSGYSRPHFIRLMKKHFGKTPQQYITDLRMEVAVSLLLGSELSVDEIALKIGYQSRAHFEQNFKKRYNTTPRDMRKNKGVL